MTLITECVCQCMVKSHVLCVYVRIVEEGTHSPLMAFKWEDFCIPSSKNRAMDRWKHVPLQILQEHFIIFWLYALICPPHTRQQGS